MKIKINQIEGYAYGAIQPSITLIFFEDTIDVKKHEAGFKKILDKLPRFEDDHRFSTGDEEIEQATPRFLFVTILDTLNHFCGDQRFTPIRVFDKDRSKCFSLPTLSTEMSRFNVNAILTLQKIANKGALSKELVGFLEKQKRLARQFLPAGTNAGSFIAAAAERKIPFKIFNRKHIIFGYGSGSRIFNSSLTDEESVIGVQLAKSKVDTNRLLKMSGIPVAEQAQVRTINDAHRFAEKVGYPVILKPESEEQGRGIFTNIIDQAELRDCFEKAYKDYKKLILENFVTGLSYRVQVHRGKAVEAWEITPPFLTGDGASSILELIKIENSAADRNDVNSPLKPIPIDAVTELNLQKVGLTLNYTPSVGEVIMLSATSNVSRGGTPKRCLTQLHEANIGLCTQAALTLGLHVAGVDIISEDASKPWYENNTVICEVNSQPQFGDIRLYPHLYKDIIGRVPNSGCTITLKVSHKFKSLPLNIFNKTVSDIVVQVTPRYLLTLGSPTQFFDDLSFEDDVSIEDQEKIISMISNVSCDTL